MTASEGAEPLQGRALRLQGAGQTLEVATLRVGGPSRPTLVLLHEGLGSLAMWRDFPSRLAHATGCDAVVYSRRGYGQSDPLPGPRGVDFMHREALEVLPELLDALAIDAPLLVGHSDGASIALLNAALAGRPLAAVVAMAPHVMVEPLTLASIRQAREAWNRTDLRQRLARYHADVDGAFRGWNDIWLAPEFADWDIRDCLGRIRCPVLAIQGQDDEYGTLAQVEEVVAAVADPQLLVLADCRHSPHRDQPEAVIDAVVRLVDRVTAGDAG